MLNEASSSIKVKTLKQWNDILDTAKENDQPVIVDFSASWCGPCKMIAPKYEEIAKRNTTTMFLTVDVDEMSDVAQEYGVKAMPTFLALQGNGKVLGKVVGVNIAALEELVVKCAASVPTKDRAKKLEKEGDEAMGAGEYVHSVECYSRAIQLVPDSAMLYAKRASAYIKETKVLRIKAREDAEKATELDKENGAGWLRKAEALLVSLDEEGVGEGDLEVRMHRQLNNAIVALENAISFATGEEKAEAKRLVLNTLAHKSAMY